MKTNNEIDPSTFKIAVVGAGSWGTALAFVLARNGHDVVLWALEPDVAREIGFDGLCKKTSDAEGGA